MPRQRVPDMEFNYFALGVIKDLFDKKQIFINPSYQRGYIWTHTQRVKLIESIENRYSMGILVLFINDSGQYEILDGQQRLLTVKKYIDGTLDLSNTNLTPYNDLDDTEKILTNAYCIYYLKLKSHDAENKEEDIMQTFLRLQEGSPLNKAEKISAHRGAFKDEFKKAAEEYELFKLMRGDKRFRFRLLAAEMLLLELESDYENLVFPSLELNSFIKAIDLYKKTVPPAKLKYYKGNLDILYQSLNYLLTGLTPRDVLSFYLLISYLRKHKAGNQNLVNEFSAFSKEFLKNLNSFGIYAEKKPNNLTEEIFKKYRTYKFEAKVMTTPESIKKRFEIILNEYKRLKPYIEKDPKRYFDEEQKRILYFRQKGLCKFCKNPIDFKASSADHIKMHSAGGKTDDLDSAQLLHNRCHIKIEKTRQSS